MERAEIPSDVEVAFVGATVASVTAARQLAAAGKRVLIIDVPGTSAWQERVSGAATAVMGPVVHEVAVRHGDDVATTYFSGLADAVNTVASDAAAWGLDRRALPGWSISVDGHLAFELRHEARLMRLAGLRVDFADDQPLRQEIRPFMVRAEQCLVDIPAYVAAALDAAVQAGVTSVEADVVRFRPDALETSAGTVRAVDVVDAVGLLSGLGVGALVGLRSERRPVVELDPLTWPATEPTSGPVQAVAAFIDTPVAFLVADERGCRLIGRPGNSEVALADWARAFLGAEVRRVGSVMTESTADGLPVVGRIPGHDHRWVMRGFGPVPLAPEVWAGRELAGLLQGGTATAAPLRAPGVVTGYVRSRFGVLADPKQRVAEVLAARGLARAVSRR